MPKRALPPLPRGELSKLPQTRYLLEVMKENLEGVSGARYGRLKPLPADATLTEVITQLNKILTRMQD